MCFFRYIIYTWAMFNYVKLLEGKRTVDKTMVKQEKHGFRMFQYENGEHIAEAFDQ